MNIFSINNCFRPLEKKRLGFVNLLILRPDAFSNVHASVIASDTLLLEFFDVPSSIAVREYFLTSPLMFDGRKVAGVKWGISDALFQQLQSIEAQLIKPVPPSLPQLACAIVSTAPLQPQQQSDTEG